MMRTVEGVYEHGRIELKEQPRNIRDPTPVMITFLEPHAVDLPEHGIDKAQAADLRARLTTFAEDWERPEMDVYDDYDAAKASTR